MSIRHAVNRLGPVVLLALPLLAGCRPEPVVRDERVPPFVFRSLNLRQQDPNGRPAWELTSPEARYDMGRRVAQAQAPKGVIFQQGKPLYRLEASSGTVLNDGEVILLEGAIRVQRLGPRPVLIKAERVRWFPSRQMMEVDRRPEAIDAQTRLVARRARFLFNRDQLELRGEPRLERWTQPIDPFRSEPKGAPEVVATVSRADWDPGSGGLQAEGPVQGRRVPPGSPPSAAPQTLSAHSLEGNTRTQEYVLKKPVRFDDPSARIWLQAEDVRVDLKQNNIRTDEPFEGMRQDLRVRGRGLEVFGQTHTAVIPSDCQLDQPGESLRAQRCTWNWKTQEVLAEEGVQLRRARNRQFTRGRQIKGRLGENGQLEVVDPGGRVFSEFQVPPGSGPPRRNPPPRAPEPIRL